MKSRVATVVDSVFVNLVLCVGMLIWLRQYTDFVNALVASIGVCVCLAGLMRIRRAKKKSLSKNEKKQLDTYLFYFMLLDNLRLLDFFERLVEKSSAVNRERSELETMGNADNLVASKELVIYHPHLPALHSQSTDNIAKDEPKDGSCIPTTLYFDNCFVVRNGQGRAENTKENHLYIVDMTPKNLELDKMIGYLKIFYRYHCDKMTVFVQNGLSKDAKALLALCTKEYTIVDKVKLYGMMNDCDYLPNVSIQKLEQKRSRLAILGLLFAPTNIRKYLIASAILFLYSYFLRSNIYYMVFGFLCLTCSVVCKIRQLAGS